MNENVTPDKKDHSIRSVKLAYDIFGYGDASVLFELGRTKVLCSVTLQDGVPPFLRGQSSGWLTAEYAMLPSATHHRTTRDSNQAQRNARSVEISRLIGRSLRSIVNLKSLGEKTIYVDCDVLQADGGTRVACITASSYALQLAQKRWLKAGMIKESVISESVAAISVGLINGSVQLDLNQQQDNVTQADFNFIITQSGKIIEIQGTAEKAPVDWDQFDIMCTVAMKGINQLFEQCSQFPARLENKKIMFKLGKLEDDEVPSHEAQLHHDKNKKPAFFSLANRQPK